ncbi:MAG: hypothetical protein K2Y01_10395 [Rhabdochlamydiaceae bacterium]|nr:hypothetical protein [Rhabdochlamydiaceae bacterium]
MDPLQKVQTSLENEVDLLREVLSNMIQEESSLLNCDKSAWQELMQTRFQLMQQLKIFRQTSQEHLFAVSSLEMPCNISLLLDQLLALFGKISFQQIRNHMLIENSQHFIAIPHALDYPPPLKIVTLNKEKKRFLMTIP